MSRRKLVGILVSLPVIAVCILFEWHDLKDLPFWSAWRDWRHAPGLLALTAVFCVAALVLVVCELHVGLGRWGQLSLVVLLGGAAVCAVGSARAAGAAQRLQGGSITADTYVARLEAAVVIMTTGVLVAAAGAVLLFAFSAVRVWRHRTQLFPFLRRQGHVKS